MEDGWFLHGLVVKTQTTSWNELKCSGTSSPTVIKSLFFGRKLFAHEFSLSTQQCIWKDIWKVRVANYCTQWKRLFPSFPCWDGMLMFVALTSVRSVVSVWIPTVSSAGFADHRCINQGFGPRCFGICQDCQWNGFCSIAGPRNQHLPGVKKITVYISVYLLLLRSLFLVWPDCFLIHNYYRQYDYVYIYHLLVSIHIFYHVLYIYHTYTIDYTIYYTYTIRIYHY